MVRNQEFFWAKWEGDEALKQVGLAAQGLWMRMLCIMHKGEPYGHLTTASGRPLDAKALANGVGKSVDEIEALLAELADWEVFSKTGAGVIFSRRLVRDRLESRDHRENGRKGGMPV